MFKYLCRNLLKWRWIRSPLQLQNLAHLILVWTPRVLILSSRWMLIMAQPYLHTSTLTLVVLMTPRVNILLQLRNPRGCLWQNLRSLLTLTNSMLWLRALPGTTALIQDSRPAPSRAEKHTDKSKHKSRSRYVYFSSEEDQPSEVRHRSPKSSKKTYPDQDHPQHDPDPPYYREVALSDIPSQYAEEVDTFRSILNLPDPMESLPRSSTALIDLDDEKGRKELRPRGHSSMLPFNSIIKDTFDKFDQDFQAANLPEGKYIKAPPSTAKWYKVGQPCYEDKIQELNTDFAKICITPKPPGAPMGKVPLPILKELEHQVRQNIFFLLQLHSGEVPI